MDLDKIRDLIAERRAAVNEAYVEVRRKAEEYSEKIAQLLPVKEDGYVKITDSDRCTYMKIDNITSGNDYLTFWGYMLISNPSEYPDCYYQVQYGASTYQFDLICFEDCFKEKLKVITKEEFDAAFKEMLTQMWEYHNGCKDEINHEGVQES